MVVGNVPAEIEAFVAMAPIGAIRGWPMDSLESYIQYAKYCASCTEKDIVLP